MLELRPNCEWCDRDLPPQSLEARICSYECTYCADCVDTVLRNVCPTCGGGFVPRPIRPRRTYRDAPLLGLENQPASATRENSRWQIADLNEMTERLAGVLPEER